MTTAKILNFVEGLKFVKDYDINPKELSVLLELINKNATYSEIAERLNTSRQSATHHVRKLRRKGLVEFKGNVGRGNKKEKKFGIRKIH